MVCLQSNLLVSVCVCRSYDTKLIVAVDTSLSMSISWSQCGPSGPFLRLGDCMIRLSQQVRVRQLSKLSIRCTSGVCMHASGGLSVSLKMLVTLCVCHCK